MTNKAAIAIRNGFLIIGLIGVKLIGKYKSGCSKDKQKPPE
jgi:hypothetical protein